ncbi:hypothetical protein GRF29_1g1092279 [Pseudopithomyces chartarum]|uniref:Uncharacterized protein n=1 Tax=Pseudopithomyces chartarum TaxID=1892770 RepID=A0AAN6M988_9PLEO|nr:hypothetical protein GRF29_1g1092279 [Pseudopithomyces chartarum]
MDSVDQQDFNIPTSSLAHSLFGDKLYTHYRTYHAVIQLPLFPHLYPGDGEWERIRNDVSSIPRGALPTLRIFKDFMRWLNSLNRLFEHHVPPNTMTLTISQPCGHAVHPATIENFSHDVPCPVCIIERSTSGLAHAWRAWQEAGGPYRKAPFGTSPTANWAYHQLSEIWKFEKLRWARLVFQLEYYIEKEAAWEAELSEKKDAHSIHIMQELVEVNSARKALEYARANDPHRTESTDIPFVPHTPLNHRKYVHSSTSDRSSDENGRHVSSELEADAQSSQSSQRSSPLYPPQPLEFESSSSFVVEGLQPAPHPRSPTLTLSPPRNPLPVRKKVSWPADLSDHAKRPLSNFWRRNVMTYIPGRHECPSEDGWEDTSFMRDTEFAYDVENHSSDSEDEEDEREGTYKEGDYDGDEETYDEDEGDDGDSDSSDDHSDVSSLIGVEGVALELIQQSVEAGIDLLEERSLGSMDHAHLEDSGEALPSAHESSAVVEDNELGDNEMGIMGSPEYEPPAIMDIADMEPATGKANASHRYVKSITPFPDVTYNVSSALDQPKRNTSDLEDSDSSHSRSAKRQKTTDDGC